MRLRRICFLALAMTVACCPHLRAQTDAESEAPAGLSAECVEKWKSLYQATEEQKNSLMRKLQPIAQQRQSLMQRFAKLQTARQEALKKPKELDLKTIDGFESKKLALELEALEVQQEMIPLERQRIVMQQELIRKRQALAAECGLPPGALQQAIGPTGGKGAAASSGAAGRKAPPKPRAKQR